MALSWLAPDGGIGRAPRALKTCQRHAAPRVPLSLAAQQLVPQLNSGSTMTMTMMFAFDSAVPLASRFVAAVSCAAAASSLPMLFVGRASAAALASLPRKAQPLALVQLLQWRSVRHFFGVVHVRPSSRAPRHPTKSS